MLGSLPLVLVAGLASVASPPVVALGNVHADVHGVVTCPRHNATEGEADQMTLNKKTGKITFWFSRCDLMGNVCCFDTVVFVFFGLS